MARDSVVQTLCAHARTSSTLDLGCWDDVLTSTLLGELENSAIVQVGVGGGESRLPAVCLPLRTSGATR